MVEVTLDFYFTKEGFKIVPKFVQMTDIDGMVSHVGEESATITPVFANIVGLHDIEELWCLTTLSTIFQLYR